MQNREAGEVETRDEGGPLLAPGAPPANAPPRTGGEHTNDGEDDSWLDGPIASW